MRATLLCFLSALAVAAPAQTCSSSLGAAAPVLRQGSASVFTRDSSVEAILEVARVSIGSPGRRSTVPVEIEFRNRSWQVITAFEFRFRVQYPDGKEFTSASGSDLIESSAAAVLPGTGAEPFSPGATRNVTRNVPLGPDRALPVHAEVYPTAVLFADRSALGDGKQIAATLDARAAEAEEMADVIGDLETALASDDPQRTLAARIAQLRRSGARSGPYAKRAKVLEGLVGAGRAGLQQHIEALRIRQRTLAGSSAILRIK